MIEFIEWALGERTRAGVIRRNEWEIRKSFFFLFPSVSAKVRFGCVSFRGSRFKVTPDFSHILLPPSAPWQEHAERDWKSERERERKGREGARERKLDFSLGCVSIRVYVRVVREEKVQSTYCIEARISVCPLTEMCFIYPQFHSSIHLLLPSPSIKYMAGKHKRKVDVLKGKKETLSLHLNMEGQR